MDGWQGNFHLRTLIREATFEQSASQIDHDLHRLDAQLEGLELAIARGAERFTQVSGTLLRIALTRPFPEAPELMILFTIDGVDTCTLRWVERIDWPDFDIDWF